MRAKLLFCAVFAVGWTLAMAHQFGSFRTDKPYLAASSTEIDPCSMPNFPFDDMQEYTNGVVVNALNGGCNWDGAYLATTYSNLQNTLWYVDAVDEYTTNDAIAGLDKGTNYVWVITGETVTITTNQWTNLFVATTYSNVYPTLWYADAMDEYATNSGVTNLVGGTNWVYAFWPTNSVAQDLAYTQGWTNAYAAKDY